MIDLDELERRLWILVDDPVEGALTYEEATGLRLALDLLREMRAGALPDPAAPSMPAMNHTPTSQAMRKAAWPRSGSLRSAIIERLVRIPSETDDALEVQLGRSHQSVSAARHGLVRDGWLEPATYENGTRVTQRTRSGNAAQAWRLTPAAYRRLRMVDR